MKVVNVEHSTMTHCSRCGKLVSTDSEGRYPLVQRDQYGKVVQVFCYTCADLRVSELQVEAQLKSVEQFYTF